MPIDLEQRVIVIVGGTTGLGLSAARACVRAGARVVIVGRHAATAEQAAEELSAAARAFVGDASEPTTAANAIRVACSEFGRFDGLYHVAGGSGRRFGDGPLHQLTDEGIRHTLDGNLVGLMYSNRAAVQSFLEHGTPGVVLNMSSVLGFSPSPHFFATHAYAAAKAAVIGFTRSCAAYYAPHNIRINAIAPALVETPMSQRAANDPAIREFIGRKQPLDGGRIGRPEDLDDAVIYLLSDAARFVTGQTFVIDGGWSVSEGHAS